MKPLTFQLAGANFTLESYQYMYSGNGHDSPKCTVAVSYINDEQGLYILGDTFLRTYVSSFNYTNSTIMLGMNINAPTKLRATRGWEFWFMIAILSVSGLMLLLALLYCIKKKW